MFRSFSFKELGDLCPFFIIKIDPLYKIIILNKGPGCFDWSRVQMIDPILSTLLGSPEVFPLRHYVEVSSNIIPHILASFATNIKKMNLIKVLSIAISSSIHFPLLNPFLRICRAWYSSRIGLWCLKISLKKIQSSSVWNRWKINHMRDAPFVEKSITNEEPDIYF